MFEGSFYFKDLDEVKIELQELNGINFYILKKCSQILNSLDSKYATDVEKLKLQSLKLKYQKLKRADKIYKEINKDLGNDEAKFLSKNSKATLKELQNFLVDLGELWVFDIQNSLKMRKINLEKIKDILRSQKQIIYRHITSKDKQERKNLYKQFLKNESELHKTYSELGSNFLRQYNLDCDKHTKRSVWSDVLCIINLIVTNLKTTFWLCVFFGACFCIPYFLNINQVLQTNLNNIVYLLFGVSILAFLYICIIILFLMSYSYAIFKNNIKHKFTNFIFWIMQIYMFIILILPFIYDFKILKKIFDILLNNLNLALCGYFLLFVGYFGFGFYKNKNYKDVINWITLFFAGLFDILFIEFVYTKYEGISFIWLLYAFYFFIFIKTIAFLKSFEYKIIFYFAMPLAVMIVPILSPYFVKIIKLANYTEDFTIKNEFTPKDILNLPNCFEGYSLTCIDDNLSDSNRTKINNLIVEVESKDRYYFKARAENYFFYPNDKKRYFEKVIKNSCENNNSAPCYEQNATHITIKNYEKLFNGYEKERGKLFVKKFKIHKKNIEN